MSHTSDFLNHKKITLNHFSLIINSMRMSFSRTVSYILYLGSYSRLFCELLPFLG